ncbi:hypothetical protein [Kallotenue papyrolyticum]|uniref:hypothetical protein n=1 Tax=Kallotenue papyrolyticum TaxID=1325125 RepID=UPI00047854B9|nr:hypothetical protein [Kallotenue papyrolyticum]
MRLGFAVRVLGRRGLRAYDTRRPASAPHLSVSLTHLRDVIAYLAAIDVRFYRMASDLVPYATHPAWPQRHHQLEECAAELAAVGALARQRALRLTVHAPLTVQLGAEDPALVRQSCETLCLLAQLLAAMGLDDDAVIVLHAGGLNAAQGGCNAAIARWARRVARLPDALRRRLALEHDTIVSLGTALRLHALTGVPLVFDYLHFRLHNPERWNLAEGLAVALATWPPARQPKVHFASPRTELQVAQRADADGRAPRWVLRPPRPGHHADFINPWEFAAFVEAAAGARDFDVMLEAKAGDVALLRLRQDLARYAPEVAALETRGSMRPC